MKGEVNFVRKRRLKKCGEISVSLSVREREISLRSLLYASSAGLHEFAFVLNFPFFPFFLSLPFLEGKGKKEGK